MKKSFLLIVACFILGGIKCHAQKNIRLDGYVAERINSCIENRVKPQNVSLLAEPFRNLTEGDRWQSEFLGKWMLGAIASYRYNHNHELLDSINHAARMLMETQREDGYIGNYRPDDRLTHWDIWGRKYTSLALLDYYRLTEDKKALVAVRRLIDGLISELDDRNTDISSTGLYRGMPSCSILEPVVYLYNMTGDKRYLDFADSIARSIERDGNTQLVKKALDDVPVAHRFDFPVEWWAFENGHKAYEMMSCYVGLMELGKATGNPVYLQAAQAAARNIIDTEINIAGSGTAFECWYDGRERQTTPAYHTMETCVTFTWMQMLDHLWQQTKSSEWADEFERTMYNALMASLREDGCQISQYSPLEGRRQSGVGQCGLPINCCNANGPRGFALIPDFVTRMIGDTLYINLYIPFKQTIEIGKKKIDIELTNEFPLNGINTIKIDGDTKRPLTLAMRVPAWCHGNYTVKVDGDDRVLSPRKGYLMLDLHGRNAKVELDFDLKARVEMLNGMQAVTLGPVVLARDNRFNDGDIDECGTISNDGGLVSGAVVSNEANGFAWITAQIPMVLGTDLENPENSTPRMIKFCDFGSAGSDWNPHGRYRVWLVAPINAMKSSYRSY